MSPSQRETFERLAREHAGAVYRTARRVVARDDLAEEVTQEVFLRVLAHPKTYLDRPGIEPSRALRWLAVKKALEVMRAGRNRVRREERAMEGSTGTTPPHDDPGARGESREVHAALADALARLPDELRVAVALRFQENWTFAEIASATEVSEPSAHDRVRRGLEKLRGWLTSAGFGAAAMTIERALENVAPPAAPADLASRMASLQGSGGTGAAAGSSGKVLATKGTPTLVASVFGAALLTATVAAALGVGVGSPRDDARSVAIAAPSSRPEPPEPSARVEPPRREPVAPGRSNAEAGVGAGRVPLPRSATEDRFATMGRATLSGRVALHRDDAALLESTSVVAISLRHASKGDRTRWSTTVNPDGTYTLSLPVEDDGAYFESWIEYAEARLQRGSDRRLTPGATITDHDFSFAKRIGERAGDFELLATVTDVDGAPRAAKLVVLHRLVAYAGDAPFAAHEASGTTDANGRVTLRGSKLGPKRLTLGPWMGAERTANVDFEIDRTGSLERTFAMTTPSPEASAREIVYSVSGRVVDAATGEALLDTYHSAELVAPPPGLSESALREDWLPNAPWLAPSRQVAVAFDAKPSDRFHAGSHDAADSFLVAWRMPFAPFVAGPFALHATPAIDDVTIAFEAAATIRGRVVDRHGAPLERAHLVITGVGPFSESRVNAIADRVTKQSGDGYVHGSAARTGKDGRFELRSAPLDTPFRIVALHHDHAWEGTGWITLRSGAAIDDLELALVSARR